MKLGFVSNSLAHLPLDALLARHKPFHTTRFGEFGHAIRDGLSRAGLAQSKEEETMKSYERNEGRCPDVRCDSGLYGLVRREPG